MDKPETILALQLLLEDMRGYFPVEGYGDPRLVKAKELADELKFKVHSEMIQILADCNRENRDGRHFRRSTLHGGYYGMEKFHKLTRTYHDRSAEFKEIVKLFEYPEQIFEDWR